MRGRSRRFYWGRGAAIAVSGAAVARFGGDLVGGELQRYVFSAGTVIAIIGLFVVTRGSGGREQE